MLQADFQENPGRPTVAMSESKSYRFDRFTVDCRSASLRRDGIVLPLRPKSFDVLVYLVRNPGRLVPKGELIDNVWQNVIVTENSLAQCIREIRQALRDDAQAIVQTVSKRGYLFAPPVVESVSTSRMSADTRPPKSTRPRRSGD
jgi:DNA-binding winged helix-turn-helix (wHTH) protein